MALDASGPEAATAPTPRSTKPRHRHTQSLGLHEVQQTVREYDHRVRGTSASPSWAHPANARHGYSHSHGPGLASPTSSAYKSTGPSISISISNPPTLGRRSLPPPPTMLANLFHPETTTDEQQQQPRAGPSRPSSRQSHSSYFAHTHHHGRSPIDTNPSPRTHSRAFTLSQLEGSGTGTVRATATALCEQDPEHEALRARLERMLGASGTGTGTTRRTRTSLPAPHQHDESAKSATYRRRTTGFTQEDTLNTKTIKLHLPASPHTHNEDTDTIRAQQQHISASPAPARRTRTRTRIPSYGASGSVSTPTSPSPRRSAFVGVARSVEDPHAVPARQPSHAPAPAHAHAHAYNMHRAPTHTHTHTHNRRNSSASAVVAASRSRSSFSFASSNRTNTSGSGSGSSPGSTPPLYVDAFGDDDDASSGSSSSSDEGSYQHRPTPPVPPIHTATFNARKAAAECRRLEGYVSFAAVEGLGGPPSPVPVEGDDTRGGDGKRERGSLDLIAGLWHWNLKGAGTGTGRFW